jgi:hypothetical protein
MLVPRHTHPRGPPPLRPSYTRFPGQTLRISREGKKRGGGMLFLLGPRDLYASSVHLLLLRSPPLAISSPIATQANTYAQRLLASMLRARNSF